MLNTRPHTMPEPSLIMSPSDHHPLAWETTQPQRLHFVHTAHASDDGPEILGDIDDGDDSSI